MPHAEEAAHAVARLFSESPSRFLLEVRPEHVDALSGIFDGLPLGRLGEVVGPPDAAGPAPPRLIVMGLDAEPLIDAATNTLKAAWQRPLRW